MDAFGVTSTAIIFGAMLGAIFGLQLATAQEIRRISNALGLNNPDNPKGENQ